MQACFASAPLLFGASTQRVLRLIGRPSAGACKRRARVVAVSSGAPGKAAAKPQPAAPAKSVSVALELETPGGYILDATVLFRSKQTRHTVTLGKALLKELCDELPAPVAPELLVELVFDFFINKRHDLSNTEGMIDPGIFPINYFSVSQLFYFYPEAREVLSEGCRRAVSGDTEDEARE